MALKASQEALELLWAAQELTRALAPPPLMLDLTIPTLPIKLILAVRTGNVYLQSILLTKL